MYILFKQDKIAQCIHHSCDHVRRRCLEPDSGITETFGCIRPVMHTKHSPHPVSVILKCARELGSVRLQHSSSTDNSNCLAMLSGLTKLKITAVHCEHLSTHLVTRDGREEALVRPGYEQRNDDYIQPTAKHKIVLHGGRSWKQLCSHSGHAAR